MSTSYRAAVIGTGKISRFHTPPLVNHPQVELVAASDIVEPARETFAAEFNVPRTYADAAEMLQAEQPDIVSICTWPPLHAELTELAFANGVKAVWCEKPMAVHLVEADRMVAAAEKANGVLVINHQRRFLSRYNHAIKLMRDGVIGDIIQINGICRGDALTDGTHLIDMTRWLNGDDEITRVFGAIDMTNMGEINPDGMGTVEFNKTRTRYGHHVETGSLAILFFANGVRGHLEMGSMARPAYQRFIIEGTLGRIDISGDEPFTGGVRVKVFLDSGASVDVPEMDDSGSGEGVLNDIIAAIETGATHRLSGASGRADLEVIHAIYQSARLRKTVALPLDLTESPLEAMLAAGEIELN